MYWSVNDVTDEKKKWKQTFFYYFVMEIVSKSLVFSPKKLMLDVGN